MQNIISKPSFKIGLTVSVISLVLIGFFTDYTFTNSKLLMKNVFRGVEIINFSLIISSTVLVFSILSILLIEKIDGNSLEKSLIARAKSILVTAIFILVVSLLLYIVMHNPIERFEAWIITLYWVQSVLLSFLIGGLVVLLYLLILPSEIEE